MNVIDDPPVYVSDGANEVSVSVWFEVGTTEFADFIEFIINDHNNTCGLSRDFEELRNSMEKLQLNDASLIYAPESSAALGFGFRCGFLGMLHMEIVQERLEREFNMTVITTVPNVSYFAYTRAGEKLEIHNPTDYPDPSILESVEEPYIRAQIITKADFIGSVMTLCIAKRGELTNQVYLTTDRVELTFEMPLGEIVFDFYDKLKSVSKGYASFDYYPIGYRTSVLAKLDICVS